LAIQIKEFEENTLDHVNLDEIAGFNDEEVDIDYQEVDKNDKIILSLNLTSDIDTVGGQNDEIVKKSRPGNFLDEKIANGTKFYVITGECLEDLLMAARTNVNQLGKFML
jgi:hypothetical protein